jgi:hypothetical protein
MGPLLVSGSARDWEKGSEIMKYCITLVLTVLVCTLLTSCTIPSLVRSMRFDSQLKIGMSRSEVTTLLDRYSLKYGTADSDYEFHGNNYKKGTIDFTLFRWKAFYGFDRADIYSLVFENNKLVAIDTVPCNTFI